MRTAPPPGDVPGAELISTWPAKLFDAPSVNVPPTFWLIPPEPVIGLERAKSLSEFITSEPLFTIGTFARLPSAAPAPAAIRSGQDQSRGADLGQAAEPTDRALRSQGNGQVSSQAGDVVRDRREHTEGVAGNSQNTAGEDERFVDVTG